MAEWQGLPFGLEAIAEQSCRALLIDRQGAVLCEDGDALSVSSQRRDSRTRVRRRRIFLATWAMKWSSRLVPSACAVSRSSSGIGSVRVSQ